MEKKGINVTELNMQLLKKVEELTLYLIEKDRQLSEQEKINQSQQKQLTEQQKINQSLQQQINELAQQIKY